MQTRIGRPALVVGAVVMLAHVFPLGAQSDPRPSVTDYRGFVFGVNATAIHIRTDTYIMDSTARSQVGGGLGVQAGFHLVGGLTPFIKLEEVIVTRQNGNYHVRSFDYGVRWSVLPLSKLLGRATPYVEAGGTSRWIMQKNARNEWRSYEVVEGEQYFVPIPRVTSNDIMAAFGAGVDVPVGRRMELHAGVSRASGRFESIRFNGGSIATNGFEATDLRFHVGLSRRLQGP